MLTKNKINYFRSNNIISNVLTQGEDGPGKVKKFLPGQEKS